MEVAAKAPALRLWLREGLEIPALLASPLLPAVAIPSGNGQPVMVLPGYLTGDLSSVRLRRSLAAAGYSALGWGLGQNRGARTDLLERLVRRIDTVVARHGEQLSLIGWSLGGVFAREAAKLRPDAVNLVITLGSPFSGNLRANNAWRLYELLNDHPVDRPPLEVNLAEKPPVMTIAMWSPLDGIVAPQSARGLEGEADLQLEVACRHLNFARAARGIQAIGAALSQHLAVR
jgi:pimeloyl-ACP methyl ester carboxylesterase